MAAECGDDAGRALCALHARGSAAWPGVELDVVAFCTLAARTITGPFDDLRADDLYLAIACATGNPRAIAALEKHYLAALAPALVRRGHDAAAAADAVQAVRVRFLVGEVGRGPRIAEYDGRGSLATWIRVATVRIAVSAYRRQLREAPVDDLDIVAVSRSPDLELLHQRFGAEFAPAFRTAFEALTPRERNLLRYQVIDQLGIDPIAALYGVHRATAARWIAHAREALLDGVRRALQHRLQVGTDELDSLLQLLRSRLELSLRLLLTPSPATG